MPGNLPPILKTDDCNNYNGYNTIRSKIDPKKTITKKQGSVTNYTYKDKNGKVLMTAESGSKYGISNNTLYMYKGSNGKEVRLWDNNSDNTIEMMRVDGDNFYLADTDKNGKFDMKNFDDGTSSSINIISRFFDWISDKFFNYN